MSVCNLCHDHIDRANDCCKLTGTHIEPIETFGYITPDDCPLQPSRAAPCKHEWHLDDSLLDKHSNIVDVMLCIRCGEREWITEDV